jgi:7-cyano-7-deazaguanine synthase in queuosine biosynthesis
MRDFKIYCGEHAQATTEVQEDVIKLQLWTGQAHENITLKIEDVHQPLYTDIPRPFHDLIEIAAYVYAADQKAKRSFKDANSFGGKWRRNLHFRIPVRCKALWESPEVSNCLTELLNFISDDYYTFEFTQAKRPPALQTYLDISDPVEPAIDVQQVVMFSGGLDSLAGAIEETINQKRKTLLVSHRPTAKNNRILNTLIRTIRGRADTKLEPQSVKIRASLQNKAARDYTQRTRSFLFASFGVALAKMLRLDNLRFYENGVISLNLPICAQVVGSRATRTTHPRVLVGFEKLFSLIGEQSFTVENPFLWKTKAEVIKVIVDAGFGSSIAESVSCAHTWERKNTVTHCGTCSQCLDRRLAMLAADAEEYDPLDRYKIDAFTEQRSNEDDKILASNYINRANTVARLKSPIELASQYPTVLRALAALPERSHGSPARVFELYKRHANEVGEAIDKLTVLHSKALRLRTLPDGSLLYAIHQMGNSLRLPAVRANEKPRNFFWKRGSVWEFRYQGGKAELIQNNQKGCEYIQYLLARPNQRFPVYEVLGELTVDLVTEIESGVVNIADVAEGYQISEGERLSDLGAQADARALREYKADMIEKLEEARDARARGDDITANKLAEEAIEINAELGRR